ncbi:MAG: hypothetical protein PHP26_02570 [Syntrophomonas sp.]|uniref:hypothetical protein n=1 Tax=Syntrophomonas sp. TaxID=2053627 RepID=UPI0026201FC2|nr:hypothetical protein [Syntrophomonas sp.]MDD2510349.1 hypothetical protein [Syntrophomonas sp.]MDD3878859.1 hypothetical protein [Syntrophomonas sp.]MDD4626730.1 hypothetical protein [Syntrophomonas sp.]
MFFTFLNKEKANYLDISVLIKFSPREVLFYYYDSIIIIPWESYWKIKELAAASGKAGSPSKEWLELFEQDLNATADLSSLNDNEFIESIGPYYYLASNTRFYFDKSGLSPTDMVSSENLASITALEAILPLNKEIQIHCKSKKGKRKTTKTKEELLKDINLCLSSLREIERLNKQINYWEKILEQRHFLGEREDLLPAEPDNLPQKPEKPVEIESSDNVLLFSRLLSRQKKQHNLDMNHYNHEVKVYFIRYREYEKACDRYKDALEKWPEERNLFIDNCLNDIKKAEEKLNTARQNRQTYSEVIQKSIVHSAYQDTRTLELFKYYLKTGRANELQDCMNIYEEERNWTEIKASQERIENTIHFLQSANPDTRFADEHINLFLSHFHEKTGELVKVGG